jgi:hypothetical protein
MRSPAAPAATEAGPTFSPDLLFALSGPATLVASVRYLRAVHFRAEAFTGDERAAEQLTARTSTFLSVFHAAEVAVAGETPDPDIKKALDSLQVEQKSDRAVLTATLPTELLRKMVAEVPQEVGPTAEKAKVAR